MELLFGELRVDERPDGKKILQAISVVSKKGIANEVEVLTAVPRAEISRLQFLSESLCGEILTAVNYII